MPQTPSLFLFQYRFGEARLEEMHPGRTEAEEEDGRRKAESGGHRKEGGDRGQKV